MDHFLVSPSFDERPACIGDDHRIRPGFKAELYCGDCKRRKCFFRATMTPGEYRDWRLGVEPEPTEVAVQPVADVREFILQALFGEEMTVEQLDEMVALSRSRVWALLNSLRRDGLVVSRNTGRGRQLVWRVAGMQEPVWMLELMALVDGSFDEERSFCSGDVEPEALSELMAVAVDGEPVYELFPGSWVGGEPLFEKRVVAVCYA